MLARRQVIGGLAALGGAGKASALDFRGLGATVSALERRSGGRFGVTILDTGSGRRFEHRGSERFPMCSTFKVFLAAAILQQLDHGTEAAERAIRIPQAPLLDNSPVTSAHAGGELSMLELCAASVVQSDNAAANLLLGTIGGPAGLNRVETALNEALPGDPRDTSSPNALAGSLRQVVLGPALSAPSRQTLTGWMRACATGQNRVRAGLPPHWAAGDKTGSGSRGTTNDLLIVTPPGRPPLLVASYLTGSPLPGAAREALHVELGRALARSA